jgi:hypothetical protein
MVNLAHILSNRIVAVALRAALGGYLINNFISAQIYLAHHKKLDKCLNMQHL